MATVAGVGVQPPDLIADQVFDLWDDIFKRVAVVRIARQRLRMDGELAALAAFERRRDAHFDAKFVGLVRLAFADAFDLRGVQTVDFGAALAALLSKDAARQCQQAGELGLQPRLAF